MILIHPGKEYLQECLAQVWRHLEGELKLAFNEKTRAFADGKIELGAIGQSVF